MKYIFLSATLFASLLANAELVGEGGLSTDPTSPSSHSSGESMSSMKIACLLQSEQVSQSQAHETAQSIEKAVQKLKLDTSKFTPTAMMHFLAQIKSESGAGANLTEGGGPCSKTPKKTADDPKKSKGYGLIQVTGADNLKKAQDCIRSADPSSNADIVGNPEQTIGSCAQDKTLSAMASLCWWKMNITDNGKNHEYENKTDSSAVESITHIVNGGAVEKNLSSEAQKSLPDRERDFENMKSKANTCGENLVS